jgi:hypothetical protein
MSLTCTTVLLNRIRIRDSGWSNLLLSTFAVTLSSAVVPCIDPGTSSRTRMRAMVAFPSGK